MSKQAAYGAQHKAIRARMTRDATHCATCKRAFRSGQTKTLGHVIAVRDGGKSIESNYVVQCTSCNYAWNKTKRN
jgi:hypothetical protein